MLFYLIKYLEEFDIPGIGMFNYLTTRSIAAFIIALVTVPTLGSYIIKVLKRKKILDTPRDIVYTTAPTEDESPEDFRGRIVAEEEKKRKSATPTMGGISIILAILIPTLLFGDLGNRYILLMILTTVWLGAIGFIDDLIKHTKSKDGLSGKMKIIGQVILGVSVSAILCYSDDFGGSTATTLPFIKSHEFDYSSIVQWAGEYQGILSWIVYGAVITFIVVAVSNGANLTDGLDGLAAGTSAISATSIAIFAYVSGNTVFAGYLNIMYIPYVGELTIFISAFIGAMVGFLWLNSYPAQVFMGDTGSLAIGGIIAVLAVIIRKELLIPVICLVFLVESVSVILQTSYFKYTRKRYGVGKRIFLMAPIHHHYQKKGFTESKIVIRFWIISILSTVIALALLKAR